MDITYLGHASFKIKGKNAVIVTDPYEPSTGLKFPKVEADIVSVSHGHFDHAGVNQVQGNSFVVNGPGEYEIKEIEIVGVASFHDNKNGAERGRNTIYNFKVDKINIVHLGDLGQESLTDAQVEEIGNVDILLIPVGGFYTIDASIASKIISQLEPKIIIPMHFQDPESTIKELASADIFLKEMGKEDVEPISKLTITSEKLPEETQIVLMIKS